MSKTIINIIINTNDVKIRKKFAPKEQVKRSKKQYNREREKAEVEKSLYLPMIRNA